MSGQAGEPSLAFGDAHVDLLVVGSGAAGLSAAVEAHAIGLRTAVLTEARLDDGSTTLAQGGVAAVIPSDETDSDSLDAHCADTMTAGGGLCDERAVRSVTSAGAATVGWLQSLGARFDTARDGRMDRTREGGHSAFRVVHAGGDATGAEVARVLSNRVQSAMIPVLPGVRVCSLAVSTGGAVRGAYGHGPDGRVSLYSASAVLLATGGCGGLYASTTNPAGSTGDGIALGLRAGALAADLEFVQFHPTALWTGQQRGRLPLVSEAVRGEGGVLVDESGRSIMAGLHPLADLAPRDVVASAVTTRMRETGAEHVWLDATGVTGFRARFPTVSTACDQIGIDPARDKIPVAPAAHYQCGGLVTDTSGRTRVAGLYAAGEVARTGMHGANRLASNSLLEAMVVGRRAAHAVAADRTPDRESRHAAGLPRGGEVSAHPCCGLGAATVGWAEAEEAMRDAMSRHVAIGRDRAGLERAATLLGSVPESPSRLVASAITRAALLRTESRGCHLRLDHPHAAASWRRSIVLRLSDPSDDTSLTDGLNDEMTEAM